VRWQPFPLPGGRQSANVIATRGDQPPQLLIGGHYDSRPRAPGAEDNASGIAVILEVARLLAERDLPVQFVAFGAEERVVSGRNGHHFGSRYYVRTATAAHLAGLRGMLCIDCVGSGTRFLVQGCASDDGRLARHCRVLAWRHGLTPGGGPARLNSDHAAFARAGVPVAYYHRLPHPQTHTPHDLPYRVRPEFLQETATAVLLASEDLCAPLAALWPREPAAGGSRSG